MSRSICRFLQESSLFRTCAYEFKAPSPYQSCKIKITLRDGHYILLLQHVNDVIKGIDSFESVRHISTLRMLVHALLGYQIKPFRMSIPALGCCEFLKIIESLLDGWMAIYRTSALSPCPESAKISLVSEGVRVNWSRVDLNQCVVRYKYIAHEVFDVSVFNTFSDNVLALSSPVYCEKSCAWQRSSSSSMRCLRHLRRPASEPETCHWLSSLACTSDSSSRSRWTNGHEPRCGPATEVSESSTGEVGGPRHGLARRAAGRRDGTGPGEARDT